jgi:hypothetical protein
MRAPKRETPTNAAAQMARARERISSELAACTTTVESPMNTTPVKPPSARARRRAAPRSRYRLIAIAAAQRR